MGVRVSPSAPFIIMHKLSAVINKFLKQNPSIEQGFALVKLWKQWSKVLGEPLGQYVYPLGRKGKTLIVGAKESLILQEAYFVGEEILNKVNTFLGERFFDTVKVKMLDETVTPLNKVCLQKSPFKTRRNGQKYLNIY
ncbi:MAG: DUF721 domain-containing protein [Desulfonauticus sp.]|nr:DUF721 domain-containing protein [Desulfonauticus sp.]